MNVVMMAFLNNFTVLICSAAVAIIGEGGWKLLAIPILFCHVDVKTRKAEDE